MAQAWPAFHQNAAVFPKSFHEPHDRQELGQRLGESHLVNKFCSHTEETRGNW